MTAPATVELPVSDGQRDLRGYLRVLAKRRVTILLTTVIFVGAALAYSFAVRPTYTASAHVLVPQQPATSALQPAGNSQVPAVQNLQRTLSDAQQFAEGKVTKQLADQQLHESVSVSVSTSTTSDVLTFTANSKNRARAAVIANTYANAYIAAYKINQTNQYVQQVTALQSSLSKLQATAALLPSSSPQLPGIQGSINSLTQSIQGLQAASQVASGSGPSVISPASTPLSPSSPKLLLDSLLGLLVGLVIGVGLAFLRERLDDKIDSLDDIRRTTGNAPVVGLIPQISSWRTKEPHLAIQEDPKSAVSEAYRTLRTAVQFLGIDQPQRVIGVTSPTPGEGTSTAVANLALAFSRAGERVTVVSGDLRGPRIHEFFGLLNRGGLTTVLLGKESLPQVVQEVPDERFLRVVASGPIPPNPAEILSLQSMRPLVDTLAESADIVLIDCPPVLPVTDALLISRLTVGMLIVTVAGQTRRHDLKRSVELLRQVQAPILGTIVNCIPQTSSAAASYGYRYGYGYGYGYPSSDGPDSGPSSSSREGEAEEEPSADRG